MANLNFNTTNDTFRKLLGNGLRYKVPAFQRDYSWEQDHWDDLWQDIISMHDEDGEDFHYMGYLVLQSEDSKNYDIIDGQQRITTISLIILASLFVLKDLSNKGIDSEGNLKRLDNLRSSYIGYEDPVTLVSETKLHLNRHNDSFYQTYLVPLITPPQRNLKSSEHLLRKAFAFFKERVGNYSKENGENIAKLIDRTVDSLFFTVITVSDELNAFKVFETLNARGVRLSSTDLLKNYLFSIIGSKPTHENEINIFEKTWERIVNQLGNEDFPEFLRIYWNSKNKLVRKIELFKTVKKQIIGKESAFKLIRNLDKAANIYAALKKPSDELWNREERSYLEQLQMFKVRQPLALLMASYIKYSETDIDKFRRVLKAITIISFRYNVICNMQSRDQESIYNDISCRISKDEYEFNDIYTSLKKIYPEDKVFKTNFSEKDFKTTDSRNRKVVRYILFELEKNASGKSLDFEDSNYTIEHILPESPDNSWDHIDDASHNRNIYKIGNMTILLEKDNRKIGNCSYDIKKDVFSKSDFVITKNIPKHYADKWNEKTILSRQNNMAKKVINIWKLEFCT